MNTLGYREVTLSNPFITAYANTRLLEPALPITASVHRVGNEVNYSWGADVISKQAEQIDVAVPVASLASGRYVLKLWNGLGLIGSIEFIVINPELSFI